MGTKNLNENGPNPIWGGGPKIWSILWQRFLKKKQNAPKPSERPPVRGGNMSKRLGGIKGCKYKPLINGFPDGNNIGSTV